MILQKSKNGQFFICLPLAIVKAKGWEKGKELNIKFNERGNIELEEKK
jgi:hypothetical protein